MNRGISRQTIFFNDGDKAEFERRLSIMHDRLGVSVYAYSLMGNHYHLLLHSPPGALSEGMHLIAAPFARNANERQGRDGPLFRGRFHALAVETDAYLLTASRYIHLNPLDLGLDPRADRWSSYGVYIGRRCCPDFLDVDPLLAMFGGIRQQLVDFTEGPTNVFDSHPIGSSDVRLLIEAAIGLQDIDGMLPDETHRSLHRTLALLLLDQRMPATAIAAVRELVGPVSADALRLARQRARQRMTQYPELSAVLARVIVALPDRATAA